MKIASLKSQAKQLKKHTITVYFAARDPRTPIFVRVLAVLIAAYALSPIDLIPDFIPIIGFLDDIILIPIGISLVIRFTPPEVIETAKLKAEKTAKKPVSYIAMTFIIIIWGLLLWLCSKWMLDLFRTFPSL